MLMNRRQKNPIGTVSHITIHKPQQSLIQYIQIGT